MVGLAACRNTGGRLVEVGLDANDADLFGRAKEAVVGLVADRFVGLSGGRSGAWPLEKKRRQERAIDPS